MVFLQWKTKIFKMITSRFDIWGPQLEGTFNLPTMLINEPVENINCDIPDLKVLKPSYRT